MSLDINYCRLCLQMTEGSAKTLSKDSKIFTLITILFPGMDPSLVINSKLCKECSKYIQYSNVILQTVTKNEQKILFDLQNTQLFEKVTCRMCLNNENLEVAVSLFKNTNDAARHVIEMAIIDLDFDIFTKPVMCNSCWQIVTSIYLFKKKCFATEKILKNYCNTKKINSLNKKELEMVSLSYPEKLQQLFEDLGEDNLLFDANAKSIVDSNLTQNMYLNNFIEDKNNFFQEVPFIANTLNINSESLKEEDQIEIKEEKVCDFKQSDKNVDMAVDTMNLESIFRIQQSEITSNASEILIDKNEQPDIDTKESIHNSNDDILKKCLKEEKLEMQESADGQEVSLFCNKSDCQMTNKLQLNGLSLLHENKAELLNCSKSVYPTTRKRNLQSHMRNHGRLVHQENYNFPCDKCTHWSKTKSDLVKHMLVHQEIYNFPCDRCSYRAKRKPDLVSHMTIHQENYNFPCDKCNYQAKRKPDLVRHKLVHQENYNFQCDKCIFHTKRKSNLVSHMLIHQEIYNFSCDKCSYRAKRKPHLVSHMRIHQEHYNFPCNKCSFQTKRKSSLNSHMLIHQNKYNFQCHQCGYQAKRKSNLVMHVTVHQENYNFPCDECTHQANTKSGLAKHMLRYHNGKNVSSLALL